MEFSLLEVLRVYPNLFDCDADKEKYIMADDTTKGQILSRLLFKRLLERTDELTALKKEKISTYQGAMNAAMELISSLESQNRTMSELVDIMKNIINTQDERIEVLENELRKKNGEFNA